MARFVLVHGAFAGAWIWGPLSDLLRAAGHSVEVFDLPGSGEDLTPASGATLDITVPGGITPGNAVPLVLTLNGQPSPPVTMAVQ